MTLMRELCGAVLRRARQEQGLTLRDVAARAQMSLGYVSEVERGQKEASSELLAALAGALDVPLSAVLREVSDELAFAEQLERDDVTPLPQPSAGRETTGAAA